MEETLVIVKPDATGRSLTGRIISAFEDDGFEILQMRCEVPPRDLVAEFYAEHKGKEFYEPLLDFMTSGLACFMRLRREGAISGARSLAGPTDPAEAPAGTIRGDFGLSVRMNSVHAADSPESAARELRLIFPED